MKKFYFLDTNILMHTNGSALFGFEDNTIVLTDRVIEELDDKNHSTKTTPEVKYQVRSVIRAFDRICEFTSRIWQVHPFQEGNTRTVAVFIQKYLISMGFIVNNELFKSKSKYFRNALVRANYSNYSKGIKADKKYLVMFFENLLLGKNNKLDNNELKIKQH